MDFRIVSRDDFPKPKSFPQEEGNIAEGDAASREYQSKLKANKFSQPADDHGDGEGNDN